MESYDKKQLVRYLLFWALTLALCIPTQGIGIIVVAILAFWTYITKRTEDQFFWVLVLVSSICINSHILPKGSIYALIQRATLMLIGLIGFVQLIAQKKNTIVSALLGILIYIIYMIVPSITGWWPMVSYLKLTLFFAVFMAITATANSVLTSKRVHYSQIRSAYLSFAIIFIVGSVLLIPFPSISQARGNEFVLNPGSVSLFKGITEQAQALGPIMSCLGAILLADMLFGIGKPDKLYMVLLLMTPILIYKTSSRTAMGSYLLVSAIILQCFMSSKGVKRGWKSRIMRWSLIAGALFLVVLMCSSSFQNSIAKYILKYDSSAKTSNISWEDATRTRQGLMDVALEDFKKKPFLGNGFQVDERLTLLFHNSEGLILSAPIEKGVWITAVLQEGGLVGFSIYVIFLVLTILRMYKCKYYIGLAMFSNLHILNLGEFTLFSMSGIGGMLWTFVLIGVVMDKARMSLLNTTSPTSMMRKFIIAKPHHYYRRMGVR